MIDRAGTPNVVLKVVLQLGQELRIALSLCVGLAGYIVTMDKRLAVVETQHQAQVTSLQRTQQDQQALSKDIRDELRALRTELMTIMRDQNQNRGKR